MAGFCVSGFAPQQPNPPPPPVPPIPPISSLIVPGTFGSAAPPSATSPLNVTGASVGDVLIAFMNRFGTPSGFTMAGNLPAGWSLVREDSNAGVGSFHGPMYTGIATKVAVLADTMAGSYAFANPLSSNNEFLNVTVCCLHNAVGIDAVSYTAAGVAAALTIFGVPCAAGGEIVLVAGLYGTGSGSIISSSSGLPFAGASALSQGNVVYYQTGPGAAGISASQRLTCSNAGDAFSGYQVAITA